MRMFLLILFIILLLLTVVTYPFKIRGALHFDIFNNVGFIVTKVLWVNLVCYKINLAENGQIVIETKKIPKEKTRSQSKFTENYYKCLLSKLKLKEIELYVIGGVDSDAYLSSMLCGSVLTFSSSLFCYLKSRYKDIKIINEVLPDYQKDVLKLSSKFVVRFSVLDMLVSVGCAYKKQKIFLKEKRKFG